MNIDWSQLITKAMKDSAAQAAQLASAKAELSSRNTSALAQIARIQERINTIGFGIEVGEATEEDEAEQAALLLSVKAWKTYKFSLGKVTSQPTWYGTPVWPVEPSVPVIVADPESPPAFDIKTD
ncbi:phage tail protein [Pseudomonas sp. KK4]|uniref:phage tail protein n=1 Tax=Pseudomonas sp. KK4 TaxID=1855729 RepID=UPI00097BF74F|nr:phage tail protein [Pseudomonas sp. KK4]